MSPEDSPEVKQLHLTVRELETHADKLLRAVADRGFTNYAKELVEKVFSLASSVKSQADSIVPQGKR